MRARVAAISVDLDGVELYRGIHGVSGGAREDDDAVFARALPRLSDWAKQRGLPLTWFVIGRDLDDSGRAEMLARLAASGDELGCHTQTHPYDLTRRPAAEMRAEIELGMASIVRATGQRPSGFRAPGYVVSDTLLTLLQEQGLAYDSSVFPCPTYYALKAAAVTRLSLGHTPSRAIIDTPEMLRAPTEPYRVGRPYWFRGAGLWEIPIQVTRKSRLPFIGTALTLGGPLGARVLTRGVVGETFVNLELHGLDALDVHDGLAELAPRQRDLRIPWARKLDALDAAVTTLQRAGYGFVRLDELVARARSA